MSGKTGYCGMSFAVSLARAALHMWEEPCISGKNGSGAIFFSGCTLGCIYCQNHEISDGSIGMQVSVERLSQIMLNLQKEGAHNVNLVTPTQFAPQILLAIDEAKDHGLAIPVVYNTGGYETTDNLKMLEGSIDIFLPDVKYASMDLAKNFSKAEDYPQHAVKAVAEMVRQTGSPVFDEKGMMKKGVIVRNLILPGHTREAKEVIRQLHETFGDQIYISIMNQFTPVVRSEQYPELNRKVTKREYENVISYALDIGVELAYIQEGGTAKESFIPSFDYKGIL